MGQAHQQYSRTGPVLPRRQSYLSLIFSSSTEYIYYYITRAVRFVLLVLSTRPRGPIYRVLTLLLLMHVAHRDSGRLLRPVEGSPINADLVY
jgi:hypothetical protein